MQIFHYDQKSWIQNQPFETAGNIESTFLLSLQGRSFLSSHEYGNFVLDLQNLSFIPYSDWIRKDVLINSKQILIINQKKKLKWNNFVSNKKQSSKITLLVYLRNARSVVSLFPMGPKLTWSLNKIMTRISFGTHLIPRINKIFNRCCQHTFQQFSKILAWDIQLFVLFRRDCS